MIATAIRVKRKRTEDPVTALYFDDTRSSASARKKVRVDNVVYRLSQTVDRPDDAFGAANVPTNTTAGASATTSAASALPRDLVLERASVSQEKESSTTPTSRVFRLAAPAATAATATAPAANSTPIGSTTSQQQINAPQQSQQQDVDMLPSEITSMLDFYLETQPSEQGAVQHLPSLHARKLHQPSDKQAQALPQPTQQQKGIAPPPVVERPDAEAEDYVYDIYYRYQLPAAASVPGAPQASGEGLIGLIRFESDDEKLLGVGDEDEDDSDFMATDDEDSNAEDYYKNDYPDEDSDGGDGEGGHRSARTRDLDYNYLRGAGAGPGFPADSDGSENERYSYSNMSGYEDDDDVYGYENDYGGDLDDDEDGYGGGEASYGRPPTTRQRTRVVRRHGEATTNYDGFSDNEVVEGLEYLDIGGGGGDDEETMEQYRDRIFGQLQREIDRRGEREEDKAHE